MAEKSIVWKLLHAEIDEHYSEIKSIYIFRRGE
jgi:hypothetical protein